MECAYIDEEYTSSVLVSLFGISNMTLHKYHEIFTLQPILFLKSKQKPTLGLRTQEPRNFCA